MARIGDSSANCYLISVFFGRSHLLKCFCSTCSLPGIDPDATAVFDESNASYLLLQFLSVVMIVFSNYTFNLVYYIYQ